MIYELFHHLASRLSRQAGSNLNSLAFKLYLFSLVFNGPTFVYACSDRKLTSNPGQKLCNAIEKRNPYLFQFLLKKYTSQISESELSLLLARSTYPSLHPCFFKGILKEISSNPSHKAKMENYFYLRSFSLKSDAVDLLLKKQRTHKELYSISSDIKSIKDEISLLTTNPKWLGKKAFFVMSEAYFSLTIFEKTSTGCSITITDAAQAFSSSENISNLIDHFSKENKCKLSIEPNTFQRQCDETSCSVFAIHDFGTLVGQSKTVRTLPNPDCPDTYQIALLPPESILMSQSLRKIHEYLLKYYPSEKEGFLDSLKPDIVTIPECDRKCKKHFLEELAQEEPDNPSLLSNFDTKESVSLKDPMQEYGKACGIDYYTTEDNLYYPRKTKQLNTRAWRLYTEAVRTIIEDQVLPPNKTKGFMTQVREFIRKKSRKE